MLAHPPAPGPGRVYSQEDAAEWLGVSVKTIRRLVASGELPAYRLGRRLIRIREADLQASLDRIPTVNAS